MKVKEQEFKGCIPAEVFLGRRGSHPVSPGLEDFTATLRSTMGALPTIAVNEENNTSIDNKEGLKVTILNGDDWNDGGAQLDNMDAEGFKLESAQSNHGWVSALNPVASPPYTGARSALAGITLPSRINTAETMPILDNITNDGLIRKFSINVR